ncbi:HlyD family type I secretion periplasmic adaptor subunit [Candidatus Methylocalor cossyra]|uniref:Membrane fusion protein (MFP) family protein n=1 Tax=Candidatus Methylocalor cossyra TaxID=3108543 RepID=A0ABM9NHP4_9GAMM
MFSIPFDETGEATRIVRAGMFILIVFVGGFFTWSWLAPISGAVIADGIVKIDTNRKTLQHLEGGIVNEILVREGDYVSAGQTLLILEDAEIRANLVILRDQLHAELARKARLEAEKRFADAIRFPEELSHARDPKIAQLLANERALFQATKKSLDDEIAIVRRELGHAREEEASIAAKIGATRETIRYKQERVAAGEALAARQFIEKNQFLQLKEDLALTRSNLSEMEAQLASVRQRQSELELRIVSLRNEFAKKADDELKDCEKAIFELREKIRPAELTLGRFRVTAPIDGQVIDLKVSTVGGVVRPGDPLMDLVPKQRELVVEVKVKTNDIDLVHVAQRADLQLLAYNSRTVPHVGGSVVYVSGDALEDKTDPHTPRYYLAHIRVDEQELNKLPNIRLAPGMPVTAFIQTRPKTFFEMLIKPFEDAVARGVRAES